MAIWTSDQLDASDDEGLIEVYRRARLNPATATKPDEPWSAPGMINVVLGIITLGIWIAAYALIVS